MTKSILTTQSVHSLFMSCMVEPDSEKGQVIQMVLHKVRLDVEGKESEIKTLLEELPEDFQKGMSFLAACEDKHGNHWGEHPVMSELFALGMAAGYVTMPISEPQGWKLFPGGMPYFIVHTSRDT